MSCLGEGSECEGCLEEAQAARPWAVQRYIKDKLNACTLTASMCKWSIEMKTRSNSYRPAKVQKSGVQKSKKAKKPRDVLYKQRKKSSSRPDQALSNEVARPTRLNTLTAARNAVLNTTELLENIILNLSFFEIITLKIVSKHFSHLITRSKPIQTRLWLHCNEEPRKTWTFSEKEIHWLFLGQYSSANVEYYGKMIALKPGEAQPADVNGWRMGYMPVRLCPLLRTRKRESAPEVCQSDSAARLIRRTGDIVGLKEGLYEPPVPWSQIHNAPSTWHGSHLVLDNAPSWAQTYISSPPATEAEVELRFSFHKPRSPRTEFGFLIVRKQLRNSEGLRMRDVVFSPMQGYYQQVWGRFGERKIEKHVNPSRFIGLLERTYRAKAVLDVEGCKIRLEGCVVPSEEEWRTVEGASEDTVAD